MNLTYDAIARFYDLSHKTLVDDIPFLLRQAAETGGPALELGCGSGRLLVPLARAGIAVTGVDNSPEMLARAAVRLAGEPAEVRGRVRLVEGDVRSLALPGAEPFALAYFGYNTFLHLDETAAAATLRRLRPLLRPGARLLIDVDHPQPCRPPAMTPTLYWKMSCATRRWARRSASSRPMNPSPASRRWT